MSSSAIAVLVFLAVVSTLGAILLGIQDLRASRRSSGEVRPRRLQRRKLSPADQRRPGPVGAFDRWFLRLVWETESASSPIVVALLSVLCGLVVAAAIFLWNEKLVLAGLGMLAGTALPLLYLSWRRRRRVRALQDQLAPSLDLLARSIRAGQTLDQAMNVMGEHAPEPMAAEFRYCAKQLAMGLGMPAVMRSLVDRVQLYDVRIFATTLIVHRQTGGNIAFVLSRLAGVVRDRLNYRRQLRVATAAGRLSAGLVSIAAPAIFLFFFFFRPQYVSTMLQSPLGQMLLIGAVVLEVVGLVWTLRLLKPAY